MEEKGPIFKTKKFGNLKYRNCIAYYDYPRIFACTDDNGKIYILSEWEDEKEYESWGICDLEKWNIPAKDFLIDDDKYGYAELPPDKIDLLDTLVYDYQITMDNDGNITELEVSPRSWVNGKFIYVERN